LDNSNRYEYRELPGSGKEPLPGARRVAPIAPDETIEASLYLRDPAEKELEQNIQGQIQGRATRLTREEYARAHSAKPEDITRIEHFAREHDLTVTEIDPVSRRVVLTGKVSAFNAAFQTELHHYEYNNASYRGRTGPLMVPHELAQTVESVLGLDDRPQANYHLRFYNPAIARPNANAISYDPRTLAQLYNFPSNLNGQGEAIAIIELGGGYNTSDLTTYFQGLNIAAPQVTSVSVDGATNAPTGDANSADGEVALDIEVAGAIAPGAHIVVYFAPNTDRGFVDAITTAIHDTTNRPSVISISWGSAEDQWTDQSRQTMDQAFQTAASLGVTICAAAGDSGSSDGATDGQAHVDFPASDPYVMGCGGTRLEVSAQQVTSEAVWNDGPGSASGGGVSEKFALPGWQANAKVPPSANPDKFAGRGVPDVAGDADPQTGYKVRVDGQDMVIGGTSAVAPLWAGLIALINQRLGQSAGFLNPILYQNYQALQQNNAFRDITQGNNGAYSAGPGWDACSGLGTPNGTNLANELYTLLHKQQVTP